MKKECEDFKTNETFIIWFWGIRLLIKLNYGNYALEFIFRSCEIINIFGCVSQRNLPL